VTTQLEQAMLAIVHVAQSMIMHLTVRASTDRFLSQFHMIALRLGNTFSVSVVATLVVGCDGSITKESRSAGVSSPQDRKVFLQRRREVDCIIIGGNTARHEPYNRTPVPLVVISRSLVNPVQGNHRALFWNCTPTEAIQKAQKIFGNNILIEGGISMINELIENEKIDQLELSVTPAEGGDEKIDWKSLIARFKSHTVIEIEGTHFYSARN